MFSGIIKGEIGLIESYVLYQKQEETLLQNAFDTVLDIEQLNKCYTVYVL